MVSWVDALFLGTIRGTWWLLKTLWTSPVPRTIVALLFSWWMLAPWWWAVFWWGDPLIRWWPWFSAAAMALLVAAVASAAHHVMPTQYRGLAIGRTVAYAIAVLPAALATATWIFGYDLLGHLAGIVVELIVAAGLAAHLWWGPELRS